MMKLRRVTALVLGAAMLVGGLSACSKGGDSSDKVKEDGVAESAANTGENLSGEPEALTLPLTEEKKELTVWLVYNGTEVTDLNEIKSVQKMEELTNVHINWIPVNQQEVMEKFGLVLGSGDYPDIVYPASYPYPGGAEKGIEDGVLLDMDEYIRGYMPNYMNLLSQNEDARKQATSDDGKLHSLKIIVGSDLTVEGEGNYQGLAYRKDLLDAMGLEVPTTIDGWHDVLVACKDAGMETPLSITSTGGSELSWAWGVQSQGMGNYLQLDGSTVVFGAAMDGYGEYLETMRQWYEEGLIDPNFTSKAMIEKWQFDVLENDNTMLMSSISGLCGNNTYKQGFITREDVYLQPIVSPVLNEGDEPIKWERNIVAKDNIYVTTACEDPVLAAKWLDFQYSEQGQYLNWYGIEGETYELGGEDNTPQYTDFVLNNPDGMTANSVLQHYALDNQTWLGKHDYSAGLKLTTALSGDGSNVQQDSVELWSAPETNIALTEGLMLTEEEGDEANSKLTALVTLVQEHTVNYILGKDTTTHEDFVQQLYDYGLQEVLDIYQAAYERYLER